jgi:hypothetical protein
MADLSIVPRSPDRQQRSVWVVVDPVDVVTGTRAAAQLRVRLREVAAAPIAALSGVYCFTDLQLAAGPYVVDVEPVGADRFRYFGAERELNLVAVPGPGSPTVRNPLTVPLLPRPAYPFAGGATLARGRVVKATDGAALAGASVTLLVGAVDHGIRSRTDERGEFAVAVPTPPPAPDNASGALKTFTFRLRFAAGALSHTTADAQVKEGTTVSLPKIEFPGV